MNIENIDKEKMEFIFKVKNAVEAGKISVFAGNLTLKDRYNSIKPYEFAYIEQNLKSFDENQCKKEDLSLLLALFDGMFDHSILNLDKDHPISKYLDENKVIKNLISRLRQLSKEKFIKNKYFEVFDGFCGYEKHMKRKQNQLYPILETKGFDRPTTTMWTLDDYVLNETSKMRKILENEDQNSEKIFVDKLESFCCDVEDLVNKEEIILYPTSLKLISDKEFEEMKAGDVEIGFFKIDGYKNDELEKENIKNFSDDDFKNEILEVINKYTDGSSGILDVRNGKLTLDQINLIFRNMPVDLTYVDENDIVRFYTDTKERIFTRSKNVIGRNVYNCHPRKSVPLVKEIIKNFRAKRQKEAEFWLELPDKFLYMNYKAIYDDGGNYKGVLEMMTDISKFKNMKGFRTRPNYI